MHQAIAASRGKERRLVPSSRGRDLLRLGLQSVPKEAVLHGEAVHVTIMLSLANIFLEAAGDKANSSFVTISGLYTIKHYSQTPLWAILYFT